jgi:hypothetical protein
MDDCPGRPDMPRLPTRGVLLVLAVVLVACDSGGEREAPDDLSGTWRGTVARQGTEYTVVVELRQSETGRPSALLSGDGTVGSDEASFSFSVENGSFAPAPNEVSLPQRYEAARPGRMTGTVADDRDAMTVTIIGGPADFNGEMFALTRAE